MAARAWSAASSRTPFAAEQASGLGGPVLEQGEQEMLGRDVFVLELLGLLPRAVHGLAQRRRKEDLPRPLDLGQPPERLPGLAEQPVHVHSHLGQDFRHNVPFLGQQGPEKMLGHQLLVAQFLGLGLGRLEGLLRHHGESIPSHASAPLPYQYAKYSPVGEGRDKKIS